MQSKHNIKYYDKINFKAGKREIYGLCMHRRAHSCRGERSILGRHLPWLLTIHPIFKDRVGSSFSLNKDLRDKPRLARPVGSRDSASTSINTGFQAHVTIPSFLHE